MQILPIPGWVLYNPTFKRWNKILEEVYQRIRPKDGKVARAHGLPKVHKSFERVPSFRPAIGAIGSTHCNTGKYITNLLNPLT